MSNNQNTKGTTGDKVKAPLWFVILALAVASLISFGCTSGNSGKTGNTNATGNSNGNVPAVTQTSNSNSNTQASASISSSTAPGTTIAGSGDYAATQWSADIAPNAYRVAGDAIVNYDVAPGEYHYSDLDQMKRPGVCYAGITPKNYRDEKEQERENLPKQITGWHKSVKITVQYPGNSDKSQTSTERSHQIADSIGGDPTLNNLITGSHFQNVGASGGGMAYAETLARDWLASAPNDAWLYYCVTPVYGDGDLIPRSSYIDILSSDGKLNQHIEVYNVIGDVQGRYHFNYATGEVIEAATGKAVS